MDTSLEIIGKLIEENKALTAEVDKLRIAVRWALGETCDPEGHWFGEVEPTYFRGKPAPFGWRSHLRKIAGLPVLSYDKERRTITDAHEQSEAGK